MSELPKVTPVAVAQPEGLPWPSVAWPEGPEPPAVTSVLDRAMENPAHGTTFAIAVVQRGRLVAERYGGALMHFDREPTTVTAATPLLSWSMAKSMTHYLVGLLVNEGRLDPDARAPVAEWSDPSDPRHDITLGDLLAMRDGLDFVEDYVDGGVSHVIEMLFGAGQGDTASFAAKRPLRYEPGTFYSYSSGTTNIISRIVANVVGPGEPYRRFIQERLFDPLGMSSATATFDDAGTFIGSSYVHATARDFAKFGLLYLRGGSFDGRQLVSRDWVDTAQIPLSYDEEGETYYSWQWWVMCDGLGTYGCNGYEGQRIWVIPSADAVVVRLGKTNAEGYPALREFGREIVAALNA